jgi:hypothetical protein
MENATAVKAANMIYTNFEKTILKDRMSGL